MACHVTPTCTQGRHSCVQSVGCSPSVSGSVHLGSEMDPLSLAETLRKERQFVHRVLEDVRDTNDTIRDLLGVLHVEAWANYQLSGRLAAGTAFMKHSSVEWPLIIQHLASAKLAPLRKPADLDVGHVSAYLDRLRNDAKLASGMLLFVHDKGLDVPQLLRDLISSVYGQLLLPEDATCCQEVIRSLASAAVTRCAHPRVLLQGHESMFTSMFAEYAEHETAMRSFLAYTLQPAVVQAVAESSRLMEVDICMAVLRLSEGAITDLDEDNTRITVEEHVAWASRKLRMIMDTLFASLCTSLPMLPRFAAELLHLLQCSVAARWGVPRDSPLMMGILVTYLLDMMIIPALVNPDRFGIVPSVCLEQRVRYNLTQLASLLHSVAKVMESRKLGQDQTSTVPQSNALLIVSALDLSPLSRAIMDAVQRGAPSSSSPRQAPPPLIPGLQRCSVLVTQEQIQRLVNLVVYAEEYVGTSSTTDQDLQSRLSDTVTIFTAEELPSPTLLNHPYAVEAVDADSKRLTKPTDPAPKKGKSIRKHRFGSMDAISASAEGMEQSRTLSQSLSTVPTSAQPNHKRNKSVTLGGRNLSPSTHSTDSGVSVTSQDAVCQTCGMPHEILVIPLQGRTEPVFEEFAVMSERKFMKAMQQQTEGPVEETGESRDAEETPQPKPSGESSTSTSCNSSDSETAVQKMTASRSLQDLRGSGPPATTVNQVDPLDTSDVDYDLESMRRCQSEVVRGPRRAPPIKGKVELEDLLGVRPSPKVLSSLVTLSREEFRHQMPTVKEFCECGLFATLKWKLRLALAKLPGHCLPLTVDHSFMSHHQQQQRQRDDTAAKPARAATNGDLSVKRTLVGLLYQAASSVECSPEEGVSGGTNGSLFKDLLYWVELLPKSHILVLLEGIRMEYCQRAHYVAYLVGLQQTLADARTRISELLAARRRDWQVLVERCVEMSAADFMETRKSELDKFLANMREVELVDERYSYLEHILDQLTDVVNREHSWRMWPDRECVLNTVESHVLSVVQEEIFYPNGELDKARDDVFSHYLIEIGPKVTLDHESLQIPKMYHADAPWTVAQEKLNMMNIVRTPTAKLKCVCDCCRTILANLQQSRFGSPAGADEMFPILVYVIVRANPPNLLSTVQFINNFTAKNSSGESAYWWAQFSSAVEFSKTLKA